MKAFSENFAEEMVGVLNRMLRLEELALRRNVNLSVSEARTLCLMEDGPKRMSHLASEMKMTVPSMTVAVQKLEQKKYVVKQKTAEDRRAVYVSLTREGKRMADIYQYVHANNARAVIRDFTPEERRAFLSGLSKMNDYLDRRIGEEEKKYEFFF